MEGTEQILDEARDTVAKDGNLVVTALLAAGICALQLNRAHAAHVSNMTTVQEGKSGPGVLEITARDVTESERALAVACEEVERLMSASKAAALKAAGVEAQATEGNLKPVGVVSTEVKHVQSFGEQLRENLNVGSDRTMGEPVAQ